MNQHDSEVVSGLLREEGYELTDSQDDADLLYLNTCSVREKAENKLYSQLGSWRKLKKQNPHNKIVVAGCVAQQNRDKIIQKAPHVDLVVGTHQFRKIRDLVHNHEGKTKSKVAADWVRSDTDARFDEPFWKLQEGRRSSMITIMEGCDQMCTFCIVPYTRGREISRPPEEVLERIQRFVDQGVSEIMLLGQNVNSYGKSNKRFPDFPDLLEQISAIDGIRRIRFTSPHPQDFSLRLAEAYRDLSQVCPQAHIPLQAGNNQVLQRMKRPYTREKYVETIEMLRAHRPDVAISTDLIVGFPGETRAQFDETLEVMREVGFSQAFSFIYSARPNTKAATWDDPVPESEKKEWLYELQALQQRMQKEQYQKLIGEEQEVLVYQYHPAVPFEGEKDADGLGQITGRTPQNRIAHCPGSKDQVGSYLTIKIEEALGNSLRGKQV